MFIKGRSSEKNGAFFVIHRKYGGLVMSGQKDIIYKKPIAFKVAIVYSLLITLPKGSHMSLNKIYELCKSYSHEEVDYALEQLAKYSEDSKMEGLEFALCRYTLDKNGKENMDSFYDTKFTDKNGYVEWNDLPVKNSKGDEYYYWVAEDHIPPQYADVKFYIGEYDSVKADDGQSEALSFTTFGQDISVTAVNILVRSEIEIYKKDMETGQTVAKVGAEFQIYDSNCDRERTQEYEPETPRNKPPKRSRNDDFDMEL